MEILTLVFDCLRGCSSGHDEQISMKFPGNLCKISKYVLHFVNIIVKQTICPQKQGLKGMKTLDKPCIIGDLDYMNGVFFMEKT